MWAIISNPIVTHLLVAVGASAGGWWAAIKTKTATLESQAKAELTKIITDAKADFAALKTKV